MEAVDRLREMQQKNKVVEMTINFTLTEKGTIQKNSVRNIGLILEHDKTLIHTFAFNDFTHEIEVIKDISDLKIKRGRMKDDYDALILRYIEDIYGVLFNQNLFQLAVTREAMQHTYNPVKDTLEACRNYWDGKRRAGTFLHDYLGVDKSKITTLITKLFFVGAVAKAYDPMTKFDFVLDLVGGQGAGKTTLLQKMAMGWYTDQFSDFKDKDNFANMLRALIVNDDEMTATANSSFEILKKFITAQELEFRRPYGHNSERYDKNFVLARTTNEITYLKDRTGERRFLPLKVNKDKQKFHPVTDLDPETIHQLWGEFVYYYESGFSFVLTPEQEDELQEHRMIFNYVDETESEIDAFMDKYVGNFVSSNQIGKFLGEKSLIGNRKLAQKIKYVLDNYPGWEYTNNPKRGYKKL